MSQCRDLNFGLTTKVRVCKGACQKGSPSVTFHAPKNVGKCEGMNPHISKWAPILGIGVPMDSQICKNMSQGPKFIGLKSFLYHWKFFKT
jgi:hypothetical protein